MLIGENQHAIILSHMTDASKSTSSRAHRALMFWHEVTLSALRTLSQDLSSRQLGILLTVYLQPEQHSIKSLAGAMHISKPAICRAIDALERMKFVKRARDKNDQRNVLVERTAKGGEYLSKFADVMIRVSQKN